MGGSRARGVVLVLITLCVLLGALVGCSSLEARFIVPSQRDFEAPSPYIETWIPVGKDGNRERLHALMVPAPASARDASGNSPAIVFFHGAMTQLTDVTGAMLPIVDEAGATLVLVAYRGFGKSSHINNVTRNTMVEDGLTAVDFVRAMKGVDPDRVATFGYSFGGMTSLAVARQREWVRPVVAGGAFSSSGMSLHDRRVQWLALLAGARHEPITNMRYMQGRRVALFHPGRDDIVPMAHALRLLNAGGKAGARISLYICPDATHFNIINMYPEVLDDVAKTCREEWALPPGRYKAGPTGTIAPRQFPDNRGERDAAIGPEMRTSEVQPDPTSVQSTKFFPVPPLR